MENLTQEEIKAINCMAQHIRVFRDQASNLMLADFAEPCKYCKFAKECNYDWMEIIIPVLRYGTETKIMAPVERKPEWG